MKESVYALISAQTAQAAKARVLKDLDALTDGNAQTALEMAKEYEELRKICEELEKE